MENVVKSKSEGTRQVEENIQQVASAMKVQQEGKQTLILLEWVAGRMVLSLATIGSKRGRQDVKEGAKEGKKRERKKKSPIMHMLC